ncbi:hypothetical protein [Rhodococcus artemisiae]|uniref:Uncharacterized protein n=1 Tax=Rhodococcus artemisiae TaxID=714159 RepID=A0ABU7LK96_9NOCA|nr:hypothetical protein [Rhodococcus artemisiae]MEE2061997.1 hypothetical protein [Rhodococcus artemisiae]
MTLEFIPRIGTIGARITGIRLDEPIDAAIFGELYEVFLAQRVLHRVTLHSEKPI